MVAHHLAKKSAVLSFQTIRTHVQLSFVSASIGLEDSAILKNVPQAAYLNKWVSEVQKSNSKWTRCFHTASNGWRGSTFHSRCRELGPTIVIIRVGEYIFGGYADQGWIHGKKTCRTSIHTIIQTYFTKIIKTKRRTFFAIEINARAQYSGMVPVFPRVPVLQDHLECEGRHKE